jgi:MFS family permease
MKITKKFLVERNLAVISLTSLLWVVVHYIWRTWSSLYLLELGVSPETLGFFTVIQEAPRLLFQLPGGFLSDRFGRKKVIVYCTALQIVAPISFLFAATWEQIAPFMLFDAIVWALYSPAREALIAESLPHSKRGTAFGTYNLLTNLPQIFLPILTGILMDQVGLVRGVRIGFISTIIGHIVMTGARMLFLKETLRLNMNKSNRKIGKLSTRKFFSKAFRLRGSLLVMLVVAIISSFSLRMVQPFLVVYAVDIIGLSKTQWGMIQTLVGLFGTLLALPSGLLADRLGRRPIILIARLLHPFTRLTLLLLRDFNKIILSHTLVIIGAGLGGEAMGSMGAMAGPAWNALLADLIPSSDRGKITGFISMITGIISMPASVIGGYLWVGSGPDFLLALSFAVSMIPVFIFYFFVKEENASRP